MCRLFSIEGPEGSGKTSVAQIVARKLNEMGVKAVNSREPGGVAVAEEIRNIVVHEEMHPMTEALLFLSARTEHYHGKVKPLLDDGYTVILDRFIYSSLAIQGVARGMGTDVIKSLHNIALPDISYITFYLDIDPVLGLKRKNAQDEVQKFEKEDEMFHQRIYNYMQEVCETANNVVKIDANATLDEIADEIVECILCFKTK